MRLREEGNSIKLAAPLRFKNFVKNHMVSISMGIRTRSQSRTNPEYREPIHGGRSILLGEPSPCCGPGTKARPCQESDRWRT